ncbi:MAG: hypothetical protein N2234_05940 [Planctomycetota bacterium]|nr:hypothetical protein [Planctomycetota bacterium]
MKFTELVGKEVQILCVDEENFIDWWEWGKVDYATDQYIVLKGKEGEYVLVQKGEVKEIYLVSGRTKVYPPKRK